MKITRIFFYFLFLPFSCSMLTNCATIVGGSKYYARITVKDYPKASIEYKGAYVGTGSTLIKVPRAQANRFSFTVKQEGCEPQTMTYSRRTFRGGAFVGTILGWTGVSGGLILPWGVAVDLITGALWKPNIEEKGIIKLDYKNYNYFVEYEGCPQSPIVKY